MIFHKNKKDILNGNIPEQILLFTIPVCGAYLLQLLYQIVDSIVLGRFASVEALAAVGGSATMVINIVLNLISGITTGAMVVVAQCYGRGDMEKVKQAVKTSMFIAIVVGALISILCAVTSKPLLRLMNCPEETIPYSLIYMYFYYLGIIPYSIYQFGIYILRASGDTKISLVFTIIIAVTKILLDLLLTAALNLGVWGVALSTFLSYLICGLVVLVILHKTSDAYHYDIKDFGYDAELFKEIFKLGVPVAIQSAAFAVTNAYVSVKINEFGTNSIAAFSIYNNIDNFYWSFTNAIGAAMVTIVGQNYGNKNMKRVKQILKYGILIHFVATILFGIFEYFGSTYLASFFTTDSNVIELTTGMVKTIAVSYSSYILVEMISSTIKGCGDSMNSMIIAIIGICIVRFSFLYLVEFNNAYETLYCYPLSWGITSIMYLIYYLTNKKYKLSNND